MHNLYLKFSEKRGLDSEILSFEKYDVDTAENGYEGLKLIADNKYDVVCTVAGGGISAQAEAVAHGVSIGTVGAPTLVALGCLQPG